MCQGMCNLVQLDSVHGSAACTRQGRIHINVSDAYSEPEQTVAAHTFNQRVAEDWMARKGGVDWIGRIEGLAGIEARIGGSQARIAGGPKPGLPQD